MVGGACSIFLRLLYLGNKFPEMRQGCRLIPVQDEGYENKKTKETSALSGKGPDANFPSHTLWPSHACKHLGAFPFPGHDLA
jgi:hypothetical protein